MALPVSSKLLVPVVTSVAAGILLVVSDLQEAGLSLPGWVGLITPVLSFVLGYLKAETNPPPSALDTLRARGILPVGDEHPG